MTAVKNIPVVDIHAENVTEYWPALILAIKSSTFIALDLVSGERMGVRHLYVL